MNIEQTLLHEARNCKTAEEAKALLKGVLLGIYEFARWTDSKLVVGVREEPYSDYVQKLTKMSEDIEHEFRDKEVAVC